MSAVEQGGGTQTLDKRHGVRSNRVTIRPNLEEHPPRVGAESHGAAAGDADEHRAEAVTPVVKQLPQGTAGLGAARLLPVDGIQGLVNEEPERG